MKDLRKDYKALLRTKAKEEILVGVIASKLTEKSDIEIHVEWFPDDGYMVMVESNHGGDVGEPLSSVLDRLSKEGYLYKKEFKPIG